MRRITMMVVVVLAALVAIASGCSAAGQPEAKPENALVGTWRQVSGTFNGQEFLPAEGAMLLKHITPTQFMFVDVDKDGQIIDAAGGPYTLTADTYTETPVYGTGDFHGLLGKTQSFTWKVEGNRWLHSGTLTSGFTIEEVWERVEADS